MAETYSCPNYLANLSKPNKKKKSRGIKPLLQPSYDKENKEYGKMSISDNEMYQSLLQCALIKGCNNMEVTSFMCG
jgi:hypothetical protein